jgi:hypothetical protein
MGNEEKYYWIFSSASQTISAFIAFLVTGFAIVLNMMDSLQQKDDTLTEIHHNIKRNYYKKIFVLAIISGVSIILNLAMIYINGMHYHLELVMFIITVVFNLIAIGLAILFIITIINPNKYKIAAKEILMEDARGLAGKGGDIAQSFFMNAFAELERKIRNLLKKKGVITEDESGKIQSFRHIVSYLVDNDLISKENLYQLLQINKYRNLIFHGHLEKVDKNMVDKIKSIEQAMEKM